MIFVQRLDDQIVNKSHFQPKIPYFVQVREVGICSDSNEIKSYFKKRLIYDNKDRLYLCSFIVIFKCLK